MNFLSLFSFQGVHNKDTFKDTAKNHDFIKPMYNILEYNDNYTEPKSLSLL